jgi:hypothetical protein
LIWEEPDLGIIVLAGFFNFSFAEHGVGIFNLGTYE